MPFRTHRHGDGFGARELYVPAPREALIPAARHFWRTHVSLKYPLPAGESNRVGLGLSAGP